MKDLMLQDKRIFEMVMGEQDRQIAKWGIQDRHPFEWLAYATEEHGELAEAISEFVYCDGLQSNVIKEAIQEATLCLKIAEMFLNYDRPITKPIPSLDEADRRKFEGGEMSVHKYTKYRPKGCQYPYFHGPYYCWGLAQAVDDGQVEAFIRAKCVGCEYYKEDEANVSK